MTGIRFYLEFKDSLKRESAGTVVAILACNGSYWSSGKICFEAIAGLFNGPDSAVCGGAVSTDYLRRKCKRIREAKARSIHPTLFERLDRT